ncbi:MAG TPA: type I restriction enzyme HsdR N-terminal domain-containing protein [Flavipsychrobacter sp.]|nr:type I restriction enzyme HsdR N-terminal domain-containing protein [Flavipsychrobacter sp.]
MISLDISTIKLQLKTEGPKTLVFDPIRKRWLILTPEEHVRQYIIQVLLTEMNYPSALFSVEKQITVGSMTKRFDVVVYNRHHKPWMLVECKAPEIEISEKTLLQLLNYQRTTQCRYWLLTNGHQTLCADACNIAEIKWLDALPPYDL